MEQGIRIRAIILIWLLLSGVTSLQAQTAGDIDTLSQWRVSASVFDGYEEITHEFKYYISGSVTIDSLEYYKVYMSGISYVNPAQPSYFNHVYSGAIREYDNKWYALEFTNEDVMLYDFTMDIGDTVESLTTLGAVITVIDIDTIMIDGESKKRFFLDYGGWGNGEEYIIEDIGCSTGLFEPIIFFEFWSEMYCYAIDFSPIWLNPEGFGCDLTVGIEELNNESKISIYPNPFTTSTTIEYELTEHSHVQLTIYNAIGETILQADEGTLQPGKHTFTWTPERLSEGLYYAVLRSEDGVSVVKMVKQ